MKRPEAPRTAETGRFLLKDQRTTLMAGAMLIVLLALLMLSGLDRERRIERAVEHSHVVQTRIGTLFSLVQDAETGQRGYIITGDRAFLSPYEVARSRLAQRMAQLEALYSDDPLQLNRLRQLENLIRAKFDEMAAVIEIRDVQGAAQASARVAEGVGRRQMDAIRSAVNGLITAEADTLVRQRARAERTTLVRNGTIGLLFLTLIAVIVLGVRLDRSRLLVQKRMLDKATEDEARLRAVFDATVDGVITLNPSGSIETLNRAAIALFGYRAEELMRRDISLLLDLASDSRGWFLGRVAEPRALQEGILREMTARRQDGTTFPADVALGMMSLQDGDHVVAVIRDISERRKIEEMKDEFVATVSHELRTPLTSIAGALGLLKGGAGGVLPERAGRLVEIAEANSRRLVRLINDILDMEKIGSKATPFANEPIDLDRLSRVAVEAMSGLAEEREVSLRFVESAAAPVVLGDPDRLMQVLNNLLSNAIKFSPAAGQVEVRVARRGAVGRVCVRDHGPGVSENFQGKLFQKFAQADGSDSRGHDGTGLGLAIAKEIVERMNGEIGFSPAQGGGAEFHFDLPLIEEIEPVLPTEEPRYLICEDDLLTAEVIRDDLERHGLSADVVSTASEARHALHSGRYAGLILDIHLPDSNGLTLIRALRDAPATRTLPIVVVSGLSGEREAVEELGVLGWLPKPVDLNRLRRTLLSGSGDSAEAPALILHIDDDRDMREIARGLLGASGDVVFAESLSTARAAIKRRMPDLVILDVGLPDGSGLSLMPDLIDAGGRPVPVILYSAQDPGAEMLPASIEAVLVKSHATLPQLARAARAVILRHTKAPEAK